MNYHHHSAVPGFAQSAVSRGSHIRVEGVSKSFPDRRVLTDVSFTVSSGSRACLVGENGSGKTTLLRILAGLDQDFVGSARVPGTVGHYHQEPPFPLSWTAQEVIEDATSRQRAVLETIERSATDMARPDANREDLSRAAEVYEAALAEAERLNAWDIDSIAERVLDAFGLSGIDLSRKALHMSGGQVARLSLAWLILKRPETLLLDEPTNHLDDRGSALLVSMLASWPGPVVIASHDRAFLDEVATIILDLDPAPSPFRDAPQDDSPGSGLGITSYTGTYTDYLDVREAERRRWEERFSEEQAALKEARARVGSSHSVGHSSRPPRTEAKMAKKFYSDRNAKVVSRRVKDAERALERLEEDQVRKPPKRLSFAGLSAGVEDKGAERADTGGDGGQRTILSANRLAIPGRLAPVSLDIREHDRLLITGENGSGKSTVLKILAGAVTEFDGTLHHPSGLTIASLAQEVGVIFERHTGAERRGSWREETVERLYVRAVGEERAEHVSLGTFGLIAGRDVQRRVGTLSTGQVRRLELSVLLANPPDILLLDEPTNHFSLKLATELEDSIPDYPGAVIVASHDRWLRERWEGRRLHLTQCGPGTA
ncbi:MAG: ABC-F family ATP-binding cassette domain-containing protein [Flaviflexus sp.]|uniref:ABC-F family ATP-binding cassette domain-containing protein n=1 Tax=Flaviflexus sp. TaxID=1969482 RepID=UPI003F90A9C2